MRTRQTLKPRRTGDKNGTVRRGSVLSPTCMCMMSDAPCRSYYPDTATLSDAQMRGHYVLFGRKEHRIHRRLRVRELPGTQAGPCVLPFCMCDRCAAPCHDRGLPMP